MNIIAIRIREAYLYNSQKYKKITLIRIVTLIPECLFSNLIEDDFIKVFLNC